MALGNRKKAADSLGIPFRTFYDNIDAWRNLGPEYRRMYRLVEWRKKVGRRLKVRLEDSLLSGEPNGESENPETIRDVLARMKDRRSSAVTIRRSCATAAAPKRTFFMLNLPALPQRGSIPHRRRRRPR